VLKENTTKERTREDAYSRVEVTQQFYFEPKKIIQHDFVEHIRNRYSYLKNLLINRPEVSGAVSISKLPVNEEAQIIACILDIQKLPTGTLKLMLEDFTGTITAIISAKNEDLMKKASYLTLDETLAFIGSQGKNVFFIKDIVWPDIPNKPVHKSPDEVYAAFSGDMHFGSHMFMPKEFDKFVQWLQGKLGNEKQREIARKTKYLFIPGDVVDGVGIYPEQNKELNITDIYKQYEFAAQQLAQIPDNKHIIIIPGNHDALRLCEPQPQLYKDLAAPIYELPNVISLSNPAIVNIHKQDDFPGVDVMLYHGYSFDYFVDDIEALRLAGGYDAPDKVMEYLLKRRHLAPTYGATLALPMADDPLLIRSVPDVVVTGHVHKSKIGLYKQVLLVSGSCWQSKTVFQERVGHHPEPARVPILNLQTRKATTLRFV